MQVRMVGEAHVLSGPCLPNHSGKENLLRHGYKLLHTNQHLDRSGQLIEGWVGAAGQTMVASCKGV